MPKKIKNKQLLLLFIVLLTLVIVLFTQKDSTKERSFNKQLVEINSDEVTRLILFPKQLNGSSVTLNREGDRWMIQSEDHAYKASIEVMDNMLSLLENLQAISLVANSKEKWNEYEVSDSLAACRVQLFKGSKKAADVYIGKFNFVQPRSISSYVRLSGRKEIYKVDGFLSSAFNRNVDDLRDKTLLKDLTTNWSKITFDYPADSSFVLSKTENKWLLNGVLADSSAVASYITIVKNKSGSAISKQTPDGPVLYQLTIERENLPPVQMVVKWDGSSQVLNSSENSELWFADKKIIDQLFVSKSKFEIK